MTSYYDLRKWFADGDHIWVGEGYEICRLCGGIFLAGAHLNRTAWELWLPALRGFLDIFPPWVDGESASAYDRRARDAHCARCTCGHRLIAHYLNPRIITCDMTTGKLRRGQRSCRAKDCGCLRFEESVR